MIVADGENVSSGEVEAVLYKHPAVREVAVFGIPDSGWDELVMACVLPKPGMALSANDLTTRCRQFLANCIEVSSDVDSQSQRAVHRAIAGNFEQPRVLLFCA